MRIVGGSHRGRRLEAPAPGEPVRPTADRTREALFNILLHPAFPAPRLAGGQMLDCFAGTGAVGLEAMSRGAAGAVLIDRSLALARRNAASLGLTDRVRFIERDIARLGPRPADIPPATHAFLDPPYRDGLLPLALAVLEAGQWLVPDALVVAEAPDAVWAEARAPVTAAGWVELDRRRYGKASLVFLRHNN